MFFSKNNKSYPNLKAEHKTAIITIVSKYLIKNNIAKYDSNNKDNLETLNKIVTFELAKKTLNLNLNFNYHLSLNTQESLIKEISNAITKELLPSKSKADASFDKVNVIIAPQIKHHNSIRTVNAMKQVKNIVLVGSGKGGVGKSATTANLAIAMHKLGAKVGVLDADIFGPSIPKIFGNNKKPHLTDDDKFVPLLTNLKFETSSTVASNRKKQQIEFISIGNLISEETPMILRSPMVVNSLMQLLKDTLWQNLDYLLIDLPPGTGDIQLSLAQKAPITASVIVTTPQDLALIDAAKAVAMFNKLNIPCLGLVENMSYFICNNCNSKHQIFNNGTIDNFSKNQKLDILGKIPLEIEIRSCNDQGVEITNQKITSIYQTMAEKIGKKISTMATDYSYKLGGIEVISK